MWANLLKILIADVLIPLIKDGIFMLVNFFKVRQLRKEAEEKARIKAQAYENNPTADNFNQLP